MATQDEYDRAMKRLEGIHGRIQAIADREARDALVGGWAAEGHLMPEKMLLIAKAEEILDDLLRKANA